MQWCRGKAYGTVSKKEKYVLARVYYKSREKTIDRKRRFKLTDEKNAIEWCEKVTDEEQLPRINRIRYVNERIMHVELECHDLATKPFMVCDASDAVRLELVEKFIWNYSRKQKCAYAYMKGEKKPFYFHCYVLSRDGKASKRKKLVKHKGYDRLDNRRANLEYGATRA